MALFVHLAKSVFWTGTQISGSTPQFKILWLRLHSLGWNPTVFGNV